MLPAAHRPTPDAGMTLQGGRCPQFFVLSLFQDSAWKTLASERLFSCLQYVQFGGIFCGGLSLHCLPAQGHGGPGSDLTALHHETKWWDSAPQQHPGGLLQHQQPIALCEPYKSQASQPFQRRPFTASLQKMNSKAIHSSVFSNG